MGWIRMISILTLCWRWRRFSARRGIYIYTNFQDPELNDYVSKFLESSKILWWRRLFEAPQESVLVSETESKVFCSFILVHWSVHNHCNSEAKGVHWTIKYYDLWRLKNVRFFLLVQFINIVYCNIQTTD